MLLIIVIPILFSCATTQQKQVESKDAQLYNNRGITYTAKGQYDQAISDFTMALEINPRDALAYYHRARAYYFKKEYDKSWRDIKKAQDLGYKVPPKFLDDLRKASGRQN
jgi:tetratricopeptide (TPR) repeat protein